MSDPRPGVLPWLWEGVLELLFPSRCPGCGKAGEEDFCPQCREALPWIGDLVCRRCGIALNEGEAEDFCSECRREPRYYDRIRSVFFFRYPVRDAVLSWKYARAQGKGEILAAYLAEFTRTSGFPPPVDLIIPVPISEAKLKKRGFNQAETLARKVGEAVGAQVKPELLKRIRNTPSQSLLKRHERFDNVRNAFKLLWANRVEGKSVLLVDDIVTSSATLNECARLLRNAGAKNIYGLTLCGRNVRDP